MKIQEVRRQSTLTETKTIAIREMYVEQTGMGHKTS